jgi:ribonucleoside-diphosphate reductase alpha chain
MQIVKRNGKKEEVKFDKILGRVKNLSEGLKVEPVAVSQKVVAGLVDGISSTKIDELLAETAAVLTTEHPDYARLAARIAVSALHKVTASSFYQTMKQLYKEGVLSDAFIDVLRGNGQKIDAMIDYNKDFNFDYFGYKTLEKGYLQKINGRIVERPQHLFMRVAVGVAGVGGGTLDDIKELYDMMSNGLYTHATPTLFNAGTKRPQLSSCFLVSMKDDSIEGIYDTLKECALISKNAGGIGLHIHNIRANGTSIKGINGTSDGIIPMLKNFNETARYVNQGGRRKGSFAIYLEPWHADIEAYLDLKKNTGKEELRARDLYLALWVPDLFMKRVKEDGNWTLMCPNECPGLSDVWGEEFEKLYSKYEKENRGRKTVKAREIMAKIIESQIETGVPYMMFKDAANAKSNQQNLGTIKSSNLCCEIIEYSDAEETAVCNLASICLPKFVKNDKFDHKALGDVVRVATRNLNRVIDINYYPTPATKKSNLRHRPIGLGVQGLADVFFMLGLPFESEEAQKLNREISETIYYHAVSESVELAKVQGKYETFDGSPASKGKLQYHLWNSTPVMKYDWKALEKSVVEHGLRNSLLVAPMPTASTASIFGNVECFEAITSNLYKRMVLAGEFVLVNRYLVNELEKLSMWNKEMRDRIIAEGGSIAGVLEIPDKIKQIYKTVWEIKNRTIIDMASERGPFVCQSQSMNLWFAKPTFGSINSALFYSWEKGLKTGSYYIRTKPALEAVKVTTRNVESVATPPAPKTEYTAQEAILCSLDNPEACVACSS